MAIILDGTTGITTPGLINTGAETVVNLTTSGNTILGDAAGDTLNVAAGGLVLNSSGNVGIGTSSPATKFHVLGGNATIQSSTSGDGNIRLTNTGASYLVGMLGSANSTALSFYDLIAGAERMRITSTGNVGIGTSSPSARLDIGDGTGSVSTRINGGTGTTQGSFFAIAQGGTSNGAFGNWSSIIGGSFDSATLLWSANELRFVTGGGANERMRINSSGNVGIGTSSPDAKLDVLGGGLTSSSIALTNNDNATISANYNLVFQADRNNNIGGRSFDWRFGGKGYSDGTLQMALTQAGLFSFNSGYGSVATAYGCRAWVKFNGTGTVTINGSGNVSSITDNGNGNYTANFSTSMPDNYTVLTQNNNGTSNSTGSAIRGGSARPITATTCQIFSYGNDVSSTFSDADVVCLTVYR